MKPSLRIVFQICLGVSIVFAATGFFRMIQPKHPPVITPKSIGGNYQYPRPQPWTKMNERPIGNPFSATISEPSIPEPAVESGLILLGTLKGDNPRAIVAEKTNPAVTKIVRLGETAFGEKIVAIGRGYVMVSKEGRTIRLEAKT